MNSDWENNEKGCGEKMPNNKVFNESERPLFTEVTNGTHTLDVSDGAAVTIDFAHNEIHEGDAYVVSYLFSGVGNNNYVNMRLVTGSKPTHVVGFAAADGKAIISLRKNATYSASGTSLNIYNLNGNSTNTTVNKALRSPTISASGTLLYQTLLPGGKGTRVIGAETSSRAETILENSGDYLYRVQNVSSVTGDISIEFRWYEL